jgi:hypothetical protein
MFVQQLGERKGDELHYEPQFTAIEKAHSKPGEVAGKGMDQVGGQNF